MKISKLNCTACGAPISIPEDINQIVCTSCGTSLGIERGEGYVALKIADKLARAIESSGSQTQDAIRENTQVTRSELQKLQLSQELSAAQMQLNGIQAEIRALERGSKNLKLTAQLLALRQNEYQVMERIRTIKLQVTTPEPDDLAGTLALAEWELDWIASEMSALQGSAVQRRVQLLADLKKRYDALSASVKQMRIHQLKSRLSSFDIPNPAADDLTQISHLLAVLDQDEKSIRSLLLTPEGLAVYNEIQARRKEWKTVQKRLLEDQKRALQKNQMLEREISRSEKPGLLGAVAAGIGAGVAAVLAGRQTSRSTQAERGFAGEAVSDAVPAAAVDGVAADDSHRGSAAYVGGGCLLALLFLFIFLVVGVMAMGTPGKDDPTELNNAMAAFFFSLLIGVLLGTRAFLRRAAAGVKIKLFGERGLLIRPRVPGIGLQSLGGVRTIVAISTCVCVYLFILSMYAAAQSANPEAPATSVIIGFFLGPLAAWWAARRTHFVV